MKKKKRIIGIISGIVVIVLVCIFFIGSHPKDYSEAFKMCTRILSQNKEEMTSIALNTLNGELTASNYSSGKYKDYSYTMTEKREFVQFDIGGQGMLGGQYWSLLYCPNGLYMGESKSYYYKETNGGNNILKAERIDEHWWFLWTDYDGTNTSNN